MFNLLSGEFYKLKKSKSLLVCCVITAVFVLVLYGMLMIVDKVRRGEIENGTGGIIYVSGEEVDENAKSLFDEITVMEVLRQMFCSFGSFATAVFAAIFVIGEYINGAAKNIVGKGYARWQIFLAKYIAVMASAVLQLLVLSAAAIICGAVVEGTEQFDAVFWKNFFGYIGIQILLGMAFVGVVAAVSEICRNLAAGISIGIGLVCFSSPLTMGMDLLAKLLFSQAEWKPSDFWLLDLASQCPIRDIRKGFAVHSIIVALIWVIFAAAVGIVHIRKADIK